MFYGYYFSTEKKKKKRDIKRFITINDKNKNDNDYTHTFVCSLSSSLVSSPWKIPIWTHWWIEYTQSVGKKKKKRNNQDLYEFHQILYRLYLQSSKAAILCDMPWKIIIIKSCNIYISSWWVKQEKIKVFQFIYQT